MRYQTKEIFTHTRRRKKKCNRRRKKKVQPSKKNTRTEKKKTKPVLFFFCKMSGKKVQTICTAMCLIRACRAKEPIFCARSTCQIPLTTHVDQRSAYVNVDGGSDTLISFSTPSSLSTPFYVPVAIRFPLPYTGGDLDGVAAGASYKTRLNVYLQTAEYEPGQGSFNLSTTGSSPLPLSDGSFMVLSNESIRLSTPTSDRNTPVLFVAGRESELTALEIVTLPIAMFNVHGHFFARQGYYWIFTIVGSVLATLYIAFGRLRVWQVALAYSMAAFAVVLCEKLYHAIVASLSAGTASEVTFMIACVSVLSEGIPLTVALLIMRFATCRPVAWAVVGLLTATGFLFLAGSGWFVGTALLAVASLLRLLTRVLL